MEKKYKKVTFEVPKEEYVYLKTRCAEEGVSMKDCINFAIKIYLEDKISKLSEKDKEDFFTFGKMKEVMERGKKDE